MVFERLIIFLANFGLLGEIVARQQENPKKRISMPNKFKLDLQGKSAQDKVKFMNDIVTQMTGNATFTTPNPTLAAITTAAGDLDAAISAQTIAQQNAKTATTLVANKESAAEELLNGLADYVWTTSKGDEAKIQSAGMSLRAAKTPTTSLDAPQNLAITVGDNDGALDVHWDPVAKAKNYEIQTSDDPPTGTSWAYAKTTTKSSTTVSGLTSGAKKWLRVRALGPKELQGPWSDPAVKRVP